MNGGIGIVYDRTVINAINFLQDQISYLFSNTQTNNFGAATIPASLTPPNTVRVGSGLSYPSSLIPPPVPVTAPFTPYDFGGDLYGLGAGETNFVISPNLKDPYSIAFNVGMQQDLGFHTIMRLNYVGRLGRRLLADADGGQVIDVPDTTGASTQSMVQAFAALTTQLRAGGQVGSLTPQPWFEHVLASGYAAPNGLPDNTNLVAAIVGQLGNRGDISDMLQALAFFTEFEGFTGLLPQNVGIPSQFGSNAYLTNQGNSSYNALLLTLNKNRSHGLKFDFNYTWQHSIDNASLSANNNALFSNSGFICDILKPRACRGTSDFDVTQEFVSNFEYDLPVGRGKTFASGSSRLLDEAIGGWSLSGIPQYRTGLGVTPYSDAYLASFDNQDPAIFLGPKGSLKTKINQSNGVVYAFAGGQAGANAALAKFAGPVGLQYGSRNIVRSSGGAYFDAGLAKNFPILADDKLNLRFRADFFNVFNHPVFSFPALNIVNNASQFGQITNTLPSHSGDAATGRIGQFSLRLEF